MLTSLLACGLALLIPDARTVTVTEAIDLTSIPRVTYTGENWAPANLCMFDEGPQNAVLSAAHKLTRINLVSGQGLTLDLKHHPAQAVAISPDHAVLVVAAEDGALQTLDMQTLAVLKEFGFREKATSLLFLSPDTALAVHERGPARIWNVKTGAVVREMPEFAGRLLHANPTEHSVSTYERDAVTLRNLQTGAPLRTLSKRLGKRIIFAALVSSDGSTEAECQREEGQDEDPIFSVRTTGNPPRLLSTVHGSPGENLIGISPDGSRYLTRIHGEVYVRSSTTGKVLDHQQHGDPHFATFSKDNQSIYVQDGDQYGAWGKVVRTNFQAGNPLKVVREAGQFLELSPKAGLAATASQNTVQLLSTADWHTLKQFKDESGFITALAFSPNGRLLATASRSHTIKLWSVETGKEVLSIQVEAEFPFRLHTLFFSADGSKIGTADEPGVLVYDTTTGKPAGKKLFTGLVTGMEVGAVTRLNRDGSSMLTDKVGRWEEWDLHTGKQLRGQAIGSPAAFDSNGTLMASGQGKDADGHPMVSVWLPEQTRYALPKGYGKTAALALHSGTQLLAVACEDGKVRILDLKTGTVRYLFDAKPLGLSFSPDGTFLLVADADSFMTWKAPLAR